MKRKTLAKLATLPLMLGTSLASAADENLQQQIDSLEKRLDRIDYKAQKQIRNISDSSFRLQDRFKINGFASVGVNTSDEESFTPFGTLIKDGESYLQDTMLGLQMTFKVNDSLDAVAQLTAKGHDNYNVNMEWAYLSYKINDNWKVRAGRLRVPFYVASEYLDVGYAYPWVRPPLEIYSPIPFSSYNGVDTFYNFNVGGFDISLQAIHGIEAFSNASGTFDAIMSGAYLNVNYDAWSVRLGHSLAKANGAFESSLATSLGFPSYISDAELQDWLSNNAPGNVQTIVSQLDPATQGLLLGLQSQVMAKPNEWGELLDLLSVTSFDVGYSNIGIAYDDGRILFLAEATDLRYDNDMNLAALISGYTTFGYRFDNILPYVSYARSYTTEEADFSGTFGYLLASGADILGFAPHEQTTYSAGVRYDLKQGVSIKLQWDHATEFADTAGMYVASNPTTLPDNGINTYSLVIDAVF